MKDYLKGNLKVISKEQLNNKIINSVAHAT